VERTSSGGGEAHYATRVRPNIRLALLGGASSSFGQRSSGMPSATRHDVTLLVDEANRGPLSVGSGRAPPPLQANAKARSASARSVRKRLGCQPSGSRPGISLCSGTADGVRVDWLYLRIGHLIVYVRSFDIRIITIMRFGWEQTARRPRITRRWWAPPGTHDEENQQL